MEQPTVQTPRNDPGTAFSCISRIDEDINSTHHKPRQQLYIQRMPPTEGTHRWLHSNRTAGKCTCHPAESKHSHQPLVTDVYIQQTRTLHLSEAYRAFLEPQTRGWLNINESTGGMFRFLSPFLRMSQRLS